MKRVLIGTVVLFALMTVALSATIPALAAVPAVTATVCVWDSGGANITPTTGGITYQLGGYTYNFANNVDASGCRYQDFAAGTTNLEVWVSHNNTTSAPVTQDISVNPNFAFQTSLATVRLEDAGGAPLDGGTVRYWVGSYVYNFPGGATGSSGTPGETYAEFFPGSYQFEMNYQWTTDTKTQDISTPVVFQTTNVSLYYSGQIRYGGPNGTYAYFNSPMELLPGSTNFELAGCGVTQLAFSGSAVEQNLACLKLEDHTGSPLAGGTARGGFGASYGTWHVPGSTDAGGVLIDVRDVTGQPGDMSYEMKYNHTTEHQTQDVSLNSIFAFDTNLLTLRLETCGGTGLAGGLARFGPGASYTNWWFPDNPGVPTDATGETSGEVFPGTFSFEMQYAGTADQKLNEVLPDADHLLTWQTTNVTLNYSGDISYGGPQGDYYWFVKPSMELLPGTYWFHFRDCGRHELTFSGCSYEDNTCVPGTIIVEKQTEPDGAPGSFVFSGDAAGSIADDGQIVVGDLQAGTYTSQETVPAGWTLDSIVCDDDNSSGDVNTGTATFQLEAAETVTCTFTNVKDNTAPDCSGATASPYSLWPPLHNFVAIDVLRVRDPDGDPVAITIDSIFQDEMVAPLAPCMTSPDGGGLGTATAWVRAERWFRGDGRVYHIGFTADDGWGGTCSGEVLVGVPVNSWDRVRDGGALYDSTQKFIHPPCTPPSP